MRKQDKIKKKNLTRALREARSIDLHKLLLGWHKYKGSHNQQRLRTNKPYWKDIYE